MVIFRKSGFVVVILACVIVATLQPVEGLRCWVCDGYDQVDFQCNETNSGKSVECYGPNAACELIQEAYTYNSDSVLKGNVYVLRKCGQTPYFESYGGTCYPDETILSTTVTHCYCNHRDNCNSGLIANVGRIYTPKKSNEGTISMLKRKAGQIIRNLEGTRFSG